ncbi:MAG: M20/M25/M40 family metallo-hydrolase [Desulfobulbaceae bacterium]|nr:M20/M25/M40 family metallo-hydrolase [Desulfobulbaceae bacterium]HIJ79039.1 M20/M25/M40 family metallo-hydrolase [Deltaproteobacteria bacterium]
MNILRERLAQTFVELCEIDSPSWREKKLSICLQKLYRGEFADAQLAEDSSALATGSDCNNLVVHFPGSAALEPLFFSCHLDTVAPSIGVRVRRDGTRFYSAGDTVLGGDDKAGIAIVIEAMRYIKENSLAHAPVDFVYTTCEEVGLLGAKSLDRSLLRAKMGYALDSTGIDLAVIGAPASSHLTIDITGAAAHAGLHPERGVSAIQLAAQAIAGLTLGRLDHQSTANIGIVQGGKATNIIPENIHIEGEVRSHDPHLLQEHVQTVRRSFEEVVAKWAPAPGAELPDDFRPILDFGVSEEYPLMKLSPQDPVVRRVGAAAEQLGREINFIVAGGGSDANIFNGLGLPTAILGIGMDHVHSTDESIDLNDMVRTCELVISLLTS